MNTSGNIHHFRKTKWCFKHQRPHILHRTNSSQKKFNGNHVCVAIYSSLCASNWSLNIWNSRLTLNQTILSWSSSWLKCAYDNLHNINRHLFHLFYQCLFLMCIILYYIFVDTWKVVRNSVMDGTTKIIMSPSILHNFYLFSP